MLQCAVTALYNQAAFPGAPTLFGEHGSQLHLMMVGVFVRLLVFVNELHLRELINWKHQIPWWIGLLCTSGVSL